MLIIPNIQNIPKVQNGRYLGNRTICDQNPFPNIFKLYKKLWCLWVFCFWGQTSDIGSRLVGCTKFDIHSLRNFRSKLRKLDGNGRVSPNVQLPIFSDLEWLEYLTNIRFSRPNFRHRVASGKLSKIWYSYILWLWIESLKIAWKY